MTARPVEPRLLPDSATTDADGALVLGGVAVAELAERYGTPLFVYDEAHLRARCREAVAAFGPGVSYASKAFWCVAMARLVSEEGMSVDVSTGGELHVALAAGVPTARLTLHGNNKSDAELTRAMRAGVGRIVVDSFDEMDRIERLVPALGVDAPAVLLRITPGIDAHTHQYVRTGQDDSKFGFTLSTGLADAAVERATASKAMDLVGIHAHIGSQVFVAAFFTDAVATLAGFFKPLGLGELSIGGGIGVAYVADEHAPSITEWADAVHTAAARCGIDATITAEPGRSIAAAAAVTVYEVGTIKHLDGLRPYVSVDGGMSDNPRPVLYGSGYEAFLARGVAAERPFAARVVGKHCESGDLVVADAWLPADVAVGDLLVTPVTGAYGYSMASNYNKVPRPAVVFVAEGTAREVIRRESLEDLLRLDVG
ncbi:MAG TPA: diaminopimelate decarboxylase [Acidimicrobiales bacterium]|nr:diaminopimelate decarboxylase [Acidimicrobiales bacterium]